MTAKKDWAEHVLAEALAYAQACPYDELLDLIARGRERIRTEPAPVVAVMERTVAAMERIRDERQKELS